MLKLDLDYSPKEIQILNSVIDLFFAGVSLHNMKVADIAAQAGMGKSTVYEYFDSKDEVINQAVAYRVGCEIKELSQEIAGATDFRTCTLEVLTNIFNRCSQSSAPFFLLSLEIPQMREMYNLLTSLRSSFLTLGWQVIDDYLEVGVKDGSIKGSKPLALKRQTVLSAFSGFQAMRHNCPEIGCEELALNAYNIIIGTLSQ